MRTMLLVGAAALALTACSSPSTPAASPDFWDAHTIQGSMPEEPDTVEDVAAKSQLVVLGTIDGVTEGKDYTDPGKPAHRTSNVAIQVEKSSKPGVSKAVVEFSRQPETTLPDMAAALPKMRESRYRLGAMPSRPCSLSGTWRSRNIHATASRTAPVTRTTAA